MDSEQQDARGGVEISNYVGPNANSVPMHEHNTSYIIGKANEGGEFEPVQPESSNWKLYLAVLLATLCNVLTLMLAGYKFIRNFCFDICDTSPIAWWVYLAFVLSPCAGLLLYGYALFKHTSRIGCFLGAIAALGLFFNIAMLIYFVF